MQTSFKVAAAHAAPVYLDADASVAKVCDWIAAAGRGGVSLLVFPEVFVPGFPYWINCYPPVLQAAQLFVDSAGHYSRPKVLGLNFDAAAGLGFPVGARRRFQVHCDHAA